MAELIAGLSLRIDELKDGLGDVNRDTSAVLREIQRMQGVLKNYTVRVESSSLTLTPSSAVPILIGLLAVPGGRAWALQRASLVVPGPTGEGLTGPVVANVAWALMAGEPGWESFPYAGDVVAAALSLPGTVQPGTKDTILRGGQRLYAVVTGTGVGGAGVTAFVLAARFLEVPDTPEALAWL